MISMFIYKRTNCPITKYNPLGNGYVIPNNSNNVRKLNISKYAKNGRIIFGGIEPLVLNSYGSIEGGPGGYGSSPKNKF